MNQAVTAVDRCSKDKRAEVKRGAAKPWAALKRESARDPLAVWQDPDVQKSDVAPPRGLI